MKQFLIIIFTLLLLAGCTADAGIPEAIYGNWTGVRWTAEDKDAGRDAAQVHFSFVQPTQYEATFGDQREKGSFKVDGSKLYTTAEGQMQKMVKIVRLTNDTLEMEMNRGGTKENLVLAKD